MYSLLKRSFVIFALVFTFGLTTIAFAETQRVSGEMSIYYQNAKPTRYKITRWGAYYPYPYETYSYYYPSRFYSQNYPYYFFDKHPHWWWYGNNDFYYYYYK